MPLLRALYYDDGADHLGGRGNVEAQRLAVLRRRKDRGVGECRLQLVKRLLGLNGPRKPVVFFQEPVEGRPFSPSRDMKRLKAARHPNTF
jgi:hypothetical protein